MTSIATLVVEEVFSLPDDLPATARPEPVTDERMVAPG